MNTKLVLMLCLLSSVCYCKSIHNQNITLNETQDDRLANLEKVMRNLENRINVLNETEQKKNDLNNDITLFVVYKNNNHHYVIARFAFHCESVMFYALINSNILVLGAESTVVFEKIIINIGDHYNKYDGVFVAPRKGVYLFSWTISIYGSNYAVTELVEENNVISSTGDTGTSGDRHSNSMIPLCRMEKGNHTFIRTTGFGGTNYLHSDDNYPRSSFLGLIVRNE